MDCTSAAPGGTATTVAETADSDRHATVVSTATIAVITPSRRRCRSSRLIAIRELVDPKVDAVPSAGRPPATRAPGAHPLQCHHGGQTIDEREEAGETTLAFHNQD